MQLFCLEGFVKLFTGYDCSFFGTGVMLEVIIRLGKTQTSSEKIRDQSVHKNTFVKISILKYSTGVLFILCIYFRYMP